MLYRYPFVRHFFSKNIYLLGTQKHIPPNRVWISKGGRGAEILFHQFNTFNMNIDSVVSTFQELVQRGLRPIMNSSSGLPSWLVIGNVFIAKITAIDAVPTRRKDYILCKVTLEIDGKVVNTNLPIISMAAAAFDRNIELEVGSYTAGSRPTRVLNITGISNSAGVIQPASDIATPAVMAGVLKVTISQYEAMTAMTAPPTAAATTLQPNVPAGVTPQ